MSTIQEDIRNRVSALSATLPQDENPLAEARAEQEAETAYERAERERARRQSLRDDPSLIEVGEGVTMRTGAGGLCRAYTVIEVRRSGRELVIQADKVTVLTEQRGWDDTAPKAFEADPNGHIETITKRNDGTYIEKGQSKEWYSTRYTVGVRRDWTDYSQ